MDAEYLVAVRAAEPGRGLVAELRQAYERELERGGLKSAPSRLLSPAEQNSLAEGRAGGPGRLSAPRPLSP